MFGYQMTASASRQNLFLGSPRARDLIWIQINKNCALTMPPLIIVSHSIAVPLYVARDSIFRFASDINI